MKMKSWKLFGAADIVLSTDQTIMKTRSLSRQTITIVLVTQMLSTLALGAAALIYERNTRLHAFDVQLQGRSDSLLGAIQDAEDPSDNVTVDPAELRISGEDVYAVYNRGGRLLGTSADAPEDLIVRRNDGYSGSSIHGVSYRIYQREAMRVIDRAETGGVGIKRPVTIIYAAPDGHVRHEIVEAIRFYLIAVIFAGVLTAGVVSILLKQSLLPLAELADAASLLSPRSLEFHPPSSVTQLKELRPLVTALTGMVSSLGQAFAKEQRFFGDATHELKTAIAVVRSSVQVMMLKDRTPEQYRAGLQRVLEDNARVEKLAAQMLRLASAENVSHEQPELLDLSLAAEQVCSQLESLASLQSVRIETRLESACQVWLTTEDAHTLLSNVLSNAIQHSRPHSVVSISTMAVGSEIQLKVQDSGEGIGEEALPHIFERFYREDASRSRETGGTGLGLSICKAIVDAAKGSIQISSARGTGTTALVTFIRR